ncbi:hypothetical protein RND81_08G213000 [Saponaria officinalis]|uniref:Uncharacterized protein n=1 Tax=Saponaria officinalis TaxID=3572 RepID=A0AAW1JAK3_SAPOF
MGSIFSTLKSPSSFFTGDVGVWSETAAAHVLRVEVPWLKKDDSVNAAVVECGHVTKLKISGEIKTAWKTFAFTRLINLPENGGMMFNLHHHDHHSCVVVYDGFFLVTIPKVEEV